MTLNKLLITGISLFIITVCTAQSSSDIEELPASSAEAPMVKNLLVDYEVARTKDFTDGKKIISEQSFNEMQRIAQIVQKAAPESFSSYYLSYKQEGFTELGFSYLESAALNNEESSELYSDFLAASHILGKSDSFNEYSSKLRNSGFISAPVLEYNKNVLRSVNDQKALLITNGWDDTYPLLTLLNEEKKKLITVVNIEWLYDPYFRTIAAQKANTTPPTFNGDPYGWMNQLAQKSLIPVYYTSTLPATELLKVQNEITPMGLTFKRINTSLEEQKKENLNSWKKFSKLQLISNNSISKNYIVPLTLLETLLIGDEKESGTLDQVKDYKQQLLEKYPSLK